VAQTHEQATRMGATRAIALCQSFAGVLNFQVGKWSEAEAQLNEAVELYRRVEAASGEALSLQRLAVLLLARGRMDEARARLDEGLLAAERAAMRSHCQVRLHASVARRQLAEGAPEAAADALALGDEVARRHGHCVTCNALLLPEAVRVCLSTGRADEAEQHAFALEAAARQIGGRAWSAMATLARGRLEAHRGDRTAARGSLERSRKVFLEMEDEYDAARCLLLQAQLGGAAANGLNSEAEAAFARLGAAPRDG
jgi:ATP/maltotriose-dependent transcriptional regulator MalT